MQFNQHHLLSLHEASRNAIFGIQNTVDKHDFASTTPRPAVPDRELFQTLNLENANVAPTVAECAVHLELLEAFYTLRIRVLQSTELDDLFQIAPKRKTVFRRQYSPAKSKYEMVPAQLMDKRFARRRKKKWEYFLSIAAARFIRWVSKARETPVNRPIRSDSCEDQSSPTTDLLDLPYLPPLDVLMVWHASLLNPLDYENHCRKHNLDAMYKLAFPWRKIQKAINAEDWSFRMDEDSASWSTNTAQLETDLLQYLIEVSKSPNPVARAMGVYGRQEAERSSPCEEILSPREKSFIKTLDLTHEKKSRIRRFVGNVQRQAAFVDKMHAHLWIRSPAVEGTLRRAISRYGKFLELIKRQAGVNVTPAIDVDLVWHTDQCSAAQYRSSTIERTNRFLDHVDSLGSSTLDDGMDKTKELFAIHFGQPYVICQCWDCEALLSAVEKNVEIGFNDSAGVASLAEQAKADVEKYRFIEISRRCAPDGQHED